MEPDKYRPSSHYTTLTALQMFVESARLCTYAWEAIQNNKLHFINWQIFQNIAEHYKPQSTLLACSALNLPLYLKLFWQFKKQAMIPNASAT